MAISDAYATAAEYRDALRTAKTSDDDSILMDLLAVSRYIERKSGRFFNSDASAVARVYRIGEFGPVTNRKTLYIDDLVTLTEIKIDEDNDGDYTDETALTSSDYQLTPTNAALGPEPEPYTAIMLTSYGSKGYWPEGVNVQVTGIWGWPSVPQAIKRATIHLTAMLRMEGPRATQRIEDQIGAIVNANPQAQRLLEAIVWSYERREY